MTNEQFKQRLQLGMVIAVVAWGIYLAIGAVRGPRSFGEYTTDYRKGIVILATTAVFVACWAAAYVASRRQLQADGKSQPAVSGWNFTCAFAFLFASATTAAMTAVVWGGWTAPRWVFAAMVTVGPASAIASIIGLSNPARAGGRWLGMVALGLLLTAFFMGFYMG